MLGTGGAALAAIAPVAATKSSSGSGYSSLVFVALLIGVFYFMIIRPQRNRMKKAQETQSQLVAGVEVQTTFGLYATVTAVEDDAVVLEVAPGVHSRYAPQVVARVLTPEVEDDDEQPTDVPAEPSGA